VPATIALPSKSALADFGWEYIGDSDVRNTIAEEEQYLRFQIELLNKLHFTAAGAATCPTYKRKIGLTTRAGLIRSTLLLHASIAEATLLYHAAERGYGLPNKKYNWNLGTAMQAWKDPGSERPRQDVQAIWATIDELRQLRNHVHLFNKARDFRGSFGWLLDREDELLRDGDRMINHLRELQS
jgi:hypothetical protein